MDKIVCFGEIMLRLTPPNYQIIEDANQYQATFGGTEANVAISLAQFGHPAFFVTKLPDNQLGEAAIKYLMANHVETKYICKKGSNIGIYFLETGFGIRPSKVLYNRKNAEITTITLDDIDIEDVLKDTKWFHFSGITLSLHENVRNFVYKLLEKAKEKGIFVSFDCNYRKSLWTVDAARDAYLKIAPFVDLFFANAFDARTFFDVEPDESLNGSLYDYDQLKKLIKKTNASYVFGYDRTLYSSTENALKAYVVKKDRVIETMPIRFNIFDRIGGGDAFAAGVMHGLLKYDKKDLNFALDFGLAASVLKHTLWGDAFKLDENDVLNFMKSRTKEVSR